MTQNLLVDGLKKLPNTDKNLLKAFIVMAVLTLALGLLYGAANAFMRAGFIELEAEMAYQILTLHGVTIFFYWLYFVQAALVLILAVVYTESAGAIAWRPLARLGFIAMTIGFILNEFSVLYGVAILYNAPPEVVTEDNRAQAAYFYVGYLLLGVGQFLVAVPAIYTALKPKLEGKIETWSAVSFAAVAWAGLLIVSSMAAINIFLPAASWAFGTSQTISMGYVMGWNLLFHNVHYLPLMATALVWYTLVEVMVGVKSIFGRRFSKIIFASYLVFVPPTSLYHMFLEPDLSEVVRVLGSLLSLFISVPTLLVFMVIVATLEVHGRAHGGKGIFGWIRMLPWGNPAMSAVGMAVVNMAIGGGLSFVLIMEGLAPLLSDTFFIPGYFHFLTVGTVTLTFIAALLYIIPALSGRDLWNPSLLNKIPYLLTFGLLIFGASGVAAGYVGVPRRVFDISYGGDAPADWSTIMTCVGIGAIFMTAALAVYVYALTATFFGPRRSPGEELPGLPAVSWGGVALGRRTAWFGPLSVMVLVAGMYAFTVLGFNLMDGLAIEVIAGGH